MILYTANVYGNADTTIEQVMRVVWQSGRAINLLTEEGD